eukprot:8469290-Heterocapsa_arctica.AAC.1
MIILTDPQARIESGSHTRHINFFLWISQDPFHVRGPDDYHASEVIRGGMKGLGTEAGDNYHAWMTTQELLNYTKDGAGKGGLMEACRIPLETVSAMDHPHL